MAEFGSAGAEDVQFLARGVGLGMVEVGGRNCVRCGEVLRRVAFS